jgi:hypothetical protein
VWGLTEVGVGTYRGRRGDLQRSVWGLTEVGVGTYRGRCGELQRSVWRLTEVGVGTYRGQSNSGRSFFSVTSILSCQYHSNDVRLSSALQIQRK